MAATAVSITTPTDLNTAIADGNTPATQPTTGTFTTGFTELAAPTPITAAAGDLILDGASPAYTLTGDGVDAALIVAAGGNVTLASLNVANTAGAAAISIAAGGLVTFEEGATALDGTATTIGVISAPITGAGGISIVNSTEGTQAPLVLNAVNTYTGSTTIAANTALDLGANGSIYLSSSVVDNGVLDVSGAQTSTGGATTAVLNNLSGSGRVNVGHNTLQITETSALTFSGVIADEAGTAATGAIVGIEAGGSLTLTGASTYTGATRIYGDVILGEGGSIADSANVSLKVSGAIFDTTAANATSIHELTGVAGSTVVIGANGLTVTQDLVNASFSGVLSGATNTTGAFTLNGPDTLTLTAVETYAGDTTINGHLALSGAGSIATSGSVDVEGSLDVSAVTGGTVTVHDLYADNSAATLTLGANTLVAVQDGYYDFDGVISGSGGLTVGSATATDGGLELYGAETYTGATKIYGELDVYDSGSISASSGVSLKVAGAELYMDAETHQITLSNGEIDNVEAINTLTGVAGTFVYAEDGDLAIYQNTAASFSGSISGYGIDVLGTATLTLAGVNSYDERTYIDGSLAIGGAGSIANSYVVDEGVFSIANASGSVSIEGLTSDVTSATVVLGANTLIITDDRSDESDAFTGVISGSGGVTVTGGYLELAGANTYTGATTISVDGELYIDNGGSIANSSSIVNNGELSFETSGLTVATVISGTGEVDVYAGYVDATDTDSAGSVTFTAINTYTGETYIDGDNANFTATLNISGAGSIASSSEVYFDGNAILNISQASGAITLQSIGSAGTGDAIILGANSLVIAGPGTVGTPTLSIFDGVISGTGGVTINVGNSLTLEGADTYTGPTKVYGDLVLAEGATLASAVSLKVSGAELEIGSGYTTSVKAVINELTGVAGSTVVIDGNSVLKVVETTAATFSGVIANGASSVGSLYVDGTATLTLAGVETYTGATVINGSLALGAPAGSSIEGSIATSSSVTVNGSFYVASSTSVHDLSGTGTITVASGALTDTMAAADAHMTLSGTISGAGGLTVAGAATGPNTTNVSSLLNLSHASTYTGGTTLTGGTLELSAAGAASTGTITFADSNTATNTAVLQIDNAALTGTGTATESFANTIAGLSTTDVIDLSGLSYSTTPGASSVSFSGGHLVVTEGNVSVALTITGVTSAAGFSVYEDSHGGTFIVHDSSTTGYSPTHYHP